MWSFPEKLELAIALTLNERACFDGTEVLPTRDFETMHEIADAVGRLIEHLHSHFHELARLNLSMFSDDPRRPLLELAGGMEHYREALAEAMDGGRELPKCEDCGGVMSFAAREYKLPGPGLEDYKVRSYAFVCTESVLRCKKTSELRWSDRQIASMKLGIARRLIQREKVSAEQLKFIRGEVGMSDDDEMREFGITRAQFDVFQVRGIFDYGKLKSSDQYRSGLERKLWQKKVRRVG
jgi:hypothetical protein